MERQISYYLMDPTKNMTILVETPVLEASFPFVAQKLMELSPEAEQAGFVCGDCTSGQHVDPGAAVTDRESRRSPEGTLPALKMAGGEFCGNASMSAAVYYAMQQGLSEGTVLLDVSGAADPVEVRVKKRQDHAGLKVPGSDVPGSDAVDPDEVWYGRVHMPKPLTIGRERFPDGSMLPVVRFEGIAHVIIDGADEAVQGESTDALAMSVDTLKRDDDKVKKLAASWCEHLQTDAVGLMFLNKAHDEMCPLVYVPAAGTCVWESSCASGTTAAGAYLVKKTTGRVEESVSATLEKNRSGGRFALRQPGGTLEIEVTADGEYYLNGTVVNRGRLTAEVEIGAGVD